MTLEEQLGSVLLAITELRTDIAGENIKRDRRIKSSERAISWSRIAGAAALLVAVIACVVAGIGVRNAHDARRDAHRAAKALTVSEADTATARRFACVAFNTDRRQVIEGLASVFSVSNRDFVEALIGMGGPLSAAERAAVDAFNLNHDTVVKKKLTEALERRDCTPHGISEFLGQ